MRPWIRKHSFAVFSWAVLALAGMTGIVVLFYFHYIFRLGWA